MASEGIWKWEGITGKWLVRPEGPWPEAGRAEADVEFLGWGSHQLKGSGVAPSMGRGADPRPPNSFAVFQVLKLASPVTFRSSF